MRTTEKVLHGHALVTHVTGHLDALEDARRIGALADRAGVTLDVRTVRSWDRGAGSSA